MFLMYIFRGFTADCALILQYGKGIYADRHVSLSQAAASITVDYERLFMRVIE